MMPTKEVNLQEAFDLMQEQINSLVRASINQSSLIQVICFSIGQTGGQLSAQLEDTISIALEGDALDQNARPLYESALSLLRGQQPQPESEPVRPKLHLVEADKSK